MPLTVVPEPLRARSLEHLLLGFSLCVATGIALELRSLFVLPLALAALHQPRLGHRLRQHSAAWLLALQALRTGLFGLLLVALPTLAAAASWEPPVSVPVSARRILVVITVVLLVYSLWFLVLRALLKRGHFANRVAIVGPYEAVEGVALRLGEHPHRQFRTMGLFDEERPSDLRRLIELAQRQSLDAIVVAGRTALDTCRPTLRHQLRHLSAPVLLATPAAPAAPWLQVDDLDLAAFIRVAAVFGQERYGFVVTPNADHLVRLEADPEFRASYRRADFVLFDSRFLARFLRWTQQQQLRVCPGSDLTSALFHQIVAADDRLLVIGGSIEQVQQLRNRHGLRDLRHFIPPMGFIHDAAATRECLEFIENHSPFRFCFLAVGAPQQEKIAALLKERGIARGLVLCVGASLNFLTGGERRAPQWMQRAGMEWLFRLLQDPRRLAVRYLWRGPRVFRVLARRTIGTRRRLFTVPAATPDVRHHRSGSVPQASQRRTG